MSKLFYQNNIFNQKHLEAAFKIEQKKQAGFISLITLIIKMCFFLLAIISLIKLGYSSKVRLNRLREIQNSFSYEKARYDEFSNWFDNSNNILQFIL